MPGQQYRLADEDVYDENAPAITQKIEAMVKPEENDLHVTDEATKTMFAKRGDTNVTLKDFEIKSVIGRGSFGKVFLVVKRDNPSEVYAMKTLGKNVILEYDQVESTRLEKDILLMADHPFLVGMSYVF